MYMTDKKDVYRVKKKIGVQVQGKLQHKQGNCAAWGRMTMSGY